MQQRDIILEQIQQISKALGMAIARMIGNDDGNSPSLSIEEIKLELISTIDFNIDEFVDLDKVGVESEIIQHQFNLDHLAQIADLLMQIGASNQSVASYKCALLLLDIIDDDSATMSFDRNAKREEILKAINNKEVMGKTIISVSELSNILSQSNLIILDASPSSNKSGLTSDFEDQQIKGTRKINLVADFSDKESTLPNTLLSEADFQSAAQQLGINQESFIVVYDNLGIYSSPRVWWMFQAMGHENIAVLDGGLPAWIAEGLPTESKATTNYPLGNFKANLTATKVFGFEEMLSNLSTKDRLVLDARSAGRFAGTSPEPRAGLPSGHMPHSKSLPFAEVLTKGKYKSKEELQSIFNALNPGNEPLTFSCGSGLTACIILLAGELAGMEDHAVYDGSWTEWAQEERAVLERD